MEYKYVVLGANIIGISIVLGLSGYIYGSTRLIGLSFSFLVVGLTIVTMGYTYIGEIGELIAKLLDDESIFLTGLLDDLDLTESPTVKSCKNNDGEFILCYSQRDIDCKGLMQGIGVQGDTTYMCIRYEKLAQLLSMTEYIGDLESFLAELYIKRFKIFNNIIANLDETGEVARIEFSGVKKDVMPETAPYSPIISLVMVALSVGLNRIVRMREFRKEGDRVIFEVVLE